MFEGGFMFVWLVPAFVGLQIFSLFRQNGSGWFLFSGGSSLSVDFYNNILEQTKVWFVWRKILVL